MEFYVLTLYYCLGAVILLVVQSLSVRFCRRSRKHAQGDGPFTLASWNPKLRFIVATLDLIALILPIFMYGTAIIFALILMNLEKWDLSDSAEYLLGNMLGIGPIVSLVPESVVGDILDLIVSAWTAVLATNALGLAASMNSIQIVHAAIPTSTCGFLVSTFLLVPIVMFTLGSMAGAFLSWLEDWSFWDGFLFMTGQICLIQDPLTTMSPTTDEGAFFWACCYMFEVIVAGAIIGILSAHPKMVTFTLWVEGELGPVEEEETSEKPKEDQQDLRDEVARLKDEVSKLTERLASKGSSVVL